MIKRGNLFFDFNKQMWFVSFLYEEYEITGPPNVYGNYSKKIGSKSIPVSNQSFCDDLNRELIMRCKFKVLDGDSVLLFEILGNVDPLYSINLM
jgi:hypothetical protein